LDEKDSDFKSSKIEFFLSRQHFAQAGFLKGANHGPCRDFIASQL
jgi:hypothetical protein